MSARVRLPVLLVALAAVTAWGCLMLLAAWQVQR